MPTVAPPLQLPSVKFRESWAYKALRAHIVHGTPEIINVGPRGCGKTLGLARLLYVLGMEFENLTQVWIGRTRTLLTTNVIGTFEDEVLGLGHPLRGGRSREDRAGYDLGRGSRIWLLGMDGLSRLKGVNPDIVWANECDQFTEAEWEEFGAANRQRAVPCRFGNQVVIGDHNPAPPSHWTNRRCKDLPRKLYPRVLDDGSRMGEWFTPEMAEQVYAENLDPLDRTQHKTKCIRWFHSDNPGYWDFYTWDWMPAGRKYVTEKLGNLTRNRKSRYLEGRPVAQDGSVFGEYFDRDKHVIKPFPVPMDWPCVLAKDPGRDHPDATILAAVTPMFVMREGYKLYRLCVMWESVTGKSIGLPSTTEQDARTIDREASPRFRIVKKLGDPHMMFSSTKFSETGKSIAQQMAEFGHVFTPGPLASNQKEICDQADMITTLLTTIHPDDKEPMLQVSEECPRTIAMLEGLLYEHKSDGGLNKGDDMIQTLNDDEFDALRQIVASRPQFDLDNACQVYTHE